MNIEEFFKELEESLAGEVTDFEYSDTVSYYREYIREEMSRGKSQEEVLEALGSPRLIARSVIDARGMEEGKGEERMSNGNGGSYDNYDVQEKKNAVKSSARKVGLILGGIGVLLLVGVVIKTLLPVILVVIAAGLIVKLIRGE